MVKIFKAQDVCDIPNDMPRILIHTTCQITEKEIIDQAKSQEKSIIEKAQKTALSQIMNARSQGDQLVKEAEEKAERLMEKAEEEGYQKGIALGEEKIACYVEEAKSQRDEIINHAYKEKAEILSEVNREILDLSLQIAEKILYSELKRNEKAFLSLVLNAIKKVTWKDQLKISVSEQDYERFFSGEGQERFNQENNVEVIFEKDDVLKIGDCIVHTSKGIIDAGAHTQLEKAKEAFGV